MKKIGVLTSGGDAPGMNSAIRAVVRTGIEMGMEVYGIRRGFQGLMDDEIVEMGRKEVSGIIQRGGTILHSARCLEFKTKEGQQQAVDVIHKHGLEGIVTIGGDGSFHGAKDLSELWDIPTIGIPGTIDNDLAYTDFTLGFDTACNTALYCLNNLRDTMNSHERVSVVEVMGRNCGDIALYSGIASGAEVIIIPEVEITMDEIVQRLKASRLRGKTSNILVLAEGA
ncbi:MAG: ATP-dependent 6-phosphofructokinase, partial [Clostridia bacterium]